MYLAEVLLLSACCVTHFSVLDFIELVWTTILSLLIW